MKPPIRKLSVFAAISALVLGIMLTLNACSPTPDQPFSTPSPQINPSQVIAIPGPTSERTPTQTSLPTATSLVRSIPLLVEDDWIRGGPDAPVSLLVYGDFQSPNTVILAEQILELMEAFPDELQYVFRIYPLIPVNDKASLAGEAALSAGSRGSFWEMHDLLIQEYQTWSTLDPDEFIAWVIMASEGVDPRPDQLEQDLIARSYANEMQTAYVAGIEAGIPGVPLLLVNRTPYKLALDPINLESAVRLEILKANQFKEYPPIGIDPSKEYYADLELNIGRIRLQLFPESAPLAVNSFAYLAEQGWYDDIGFHKVLPGLLVESGDPSGTGLGDAGYYFPTEIDPVQRFDRAGMVGMSSLSPGIHSSRFFITLDAIPALDGRVTLFGRVIDGMELLENLDARDPAIDFMEPSQLMIKSVSIEVNE